MLGRVLAIWLAVASFPGPVEAQPRRAIAAPQAPSVLLPDFTALVRRDGAAVVNVSTLRYAAERTAGSDPVDDFLRRFAPGEGAQDSSTIGSGFIIDADGHILTNAHVVVGADEILVKLTDKREFRARLIGLDAPTDIALLKIDASNLAVLPTGDSSRLQVGEWVMAIGSPFGFDSSVSVGVVSAIGRILPEEQYVPYIQTDVPVNPGSSGGPLINLQGQAVGINAQIFSRSGGYMGISFAIPINLAIEVKDELKKRGRVERGRLGIVTQDLNTALAESFGIANTDGALISMLEPQGPAALAGLAAGDIVTAFNGRPVANATELARAVASSAPGSAVRLRVWRRGEMRELEATVGAFAQAAALPARSRPAGEPQELGLVLRELRPAEQRALQYQGRLYVESVSGRAARAGILPGDVILGVNNDRVDTARELEGRLAAAGRSAALLVQRDDEILFVPLRMGGN